jgi:hypothetical protein
MIQAHPGGMPDRSGCGLGMVWHPAGVLLFFAPVSRWSPLAVRPPATSFRPSVLRSVPRLISPMLIELVEGQPSVYPRIRLRAGQVRQPSVSTHGGAVFPSGRPLRAQNLVPFRVFCVFRG